MSALHSPGQTSGPPQFWSEVGLLTNGASLPERSSRPLSSANSGEPEQCAILKGREMEAEQRR
ncbi:hypothetical protein SCP_1502050 [Sparassis crispa]|uniref:Uncharacterized protein n=1 Tax=Sparassis crispa TaxID=139825 RepID=A0A401H436_9APHY|nr:hypothetical protein SCP_1502050 [Sparassis crispa]GBE89197.1 hypothetical protein SCP_1502050 [Sparassis crispa]